MCCSPWVARSWIWLSAWTTTKIRQLPLQTLNQNLAFNENPQVICKLKVWEALPTLIIYLCLHSGTQYWNDLQDSEILMSETWEKDNSQLLDIICYNSRKNISSWFSRNSNFLFGFPQINQLFLLFSNPQSTFPRKVSRNCNFWVFFLVFLLILLIICCILFIRKDMR